MSGLPDYYATLGVHHEAEDKLITAAYRALAKKYHPDTGGAASSARFLEVQEAYEVLSDPQRRKDYDDARRSRGGDRARVSNDSSSTATPFTSSVSEGQAEPSISRSSPPPADHGRGMFTALAFGVLAIAVAVLALGIWDSKRTHESFVAVDQSKGSLTTSDQLPPEQQDQDPRKTTVMQKEALPTELDVGSVPAYPTVMGKSKGPLEQAENAGPKSAAAQQSKQIYDRVIGETAADPAQPAARKDESKLPGDK